MNPRNNRNRIAFDSAFPNQFIDYDKDTQRRLWQDIEIRFHIYDNELLMRECYQWACEESYIVNRNRSDIYKMRWIDFNALEKYNEIINQKRKNKSQFIYFKRIN